MRNNPHVGGKTRIWVRVILRSDSDERSLSFEAVHFESNICPSVRVAFRPYLVASDK